MAAAKPFATMPFPLGKILPTAGTPLKLTSNYTDLEGEPVHAIDVRALDANTVGLVYLLNTSAAADKTNRLNVIAILRAGERWSETYPGLNGIDPSKIWVDVDTNGDACEATIRQI